MADNLPPPDLFTKFEPATHPSAGQTPVPTVTSPTGVIAGPAPTPDTIASQAPPVQTPAPAPTGVAGQPVSTAPAETPPSDMFTPPTLADPTGQTAISPDGTSAGLSAEAPVEYPTTKLLMTATGGVAGGALGVPAGGLVADLATVPAGAILGGAVGAGTYDILQNIIDSIRGNKNPQGQPITISQQSIDMLKNGLMSTGGIGGQAVGQAVASAGVKAAGLEGSLAGEAMKAGGSIVGGGTGVAVGSLTADGAVAVAKIWGLIPPDMRTPELLQGIKDAAINGGLDMVINVAMHSPLAVKTAARSLALKINGITPDMITDAEVASSYGINLSMNNLSKRTFINTLYRTVTSVIPAVGHPYHDLYGKQVNAITGYATNLPSKVAGGPVPSATEMGQQAIDVANTTFQPIADRFNNVHDQLLARAKASGVRFSLNSQNGIDEDGNSVPSLKQWAGTVLAPAKARATPQIDMKTGQVSSPDFGQTNVATENKPLLALANKIALAPNEMTVDQLEALGEEADAVYKKYVEQGDPTDAKVKALGNVINNFRDSLHGSFTDSYSTDPNAKSWPAIGEAFLENAENYAAARKAFLSPTGRSLLDKDANPEDIGEAMFKMDSPQQIAEMKKVVTGNMINKASSVIIQHAVSDATDGVGVKGTFDVNKFATALNLDDPSSNRYQAMAAALQGGPVQMEDLVNFVKAARQAQTGIPPKFATMLVRKMTFGGFNSVMKSVLPLGTAAAGVGVFGSSVGVIPTAGLVLLGWKGAEIMSNPKYLQDATTFLSPAAGEAERRMALFRVAQAVLPNDLRYDSKPTGKTPPRSIMERAYDVQQSGSNFLQSLVPQ